MLCHESESYANGPEKMIAHKILAPNMPDYLIINKLPEVNEVIPRIRINYNALMGFTQQS